MKVSVLGIDLGKNVCSIVGLDASGAVILRRRAKRETLIGLVAKLPPCIVAMEACCGAHHLGRLFARQGHDVRLIRRNMCGPTSTLHRSRDRLVAERTALINQLRAILLERGIVIPQGKCKLEQYLVTLMDEQDAQGLSPRMRMLIVDVRVQWQELDRRIGVFDREFAAFTKDNEDARRLATIPGVGVMIASALIAAIGKGPSSTVAIWRRGWVWFLVNRRPAASRRFSASASAATNICASC